MIGSERITHVHDTSDRLRTARIRQLNDALRKYAHSGVICLTAGVQAIGEHGVETVLLAVRQFNDFSDRNDPYGEHDLGTLRVGRTRILWKIDYFDRERRYGSPDPADPSVTTRVLTIMLASEY